jgi:hypothetical protein
MSTGAASLWFDGLVPMFGLTLTTRAFLEYLIYGAALLAASAVFVFWAIAIREPGRHLRRTNQKRSSRHRAPVERNSKENPAPERKRRRRRTGWRRNPTLAEIGGVPRRRDEPTAESGQH